MLLRRTGAAEVGRCRCGAALLPAALALAALPRAAGWTHAYTWQPGALAQGADVKADENNSGSESIDGESLSCTHDPRS